MNRSEVLAVVRDELAKIEHKLRVDGHSLEKAVDAHTHELLTYGIGDLPGTNDEERRARYAECWAYAERGRVRAAALTRLSTILIRVLRVIGGKPIFDNDAIPPTVRQSKETLRVDTPDESRESITLDRYNIETHARIQGILCEETNESKDKT